MYAAHTTPDEPRRIQPLAEHLHQVAAQSAAFAAHFGAQDVARLIGLCHDIGKYSAAAQKRLLHGGGKVDHATAGGLEINRYCGYFGAYCIFGHHGGLPNGTKGSEPEQRTPLLARLKYRPCHEIEDYSAFHSEISLAEPDPPAFRPLGQGGFSKSMLIRMLFSCLVDADFLDTEAFMSDGQVQRGAYDSIETLYDKLTAYIQPLLHPGNALNQKRSEILRCCLAKAAGERGLYSLTVPTGGGKTISSLAFALRHAKEKGLRRVIYVIPYTTIIEQNAAVFADILGRENVLEHHSGANYDNQTADELAVRHYLATENWDAPVVVTTNVQFFESLFGYKTSKCRKLHNVSNSVIIFDEAQMLPNHYLQACVRSMTELVYNYNSTVVLCSATQPALDGFFPKEVRRTEICDDPAALYDFFRRTVIQDAGTLSDEELAQRLNREQQVLCIVNTRKQAQNVYKLLEGEGCFHLSTMMYPEHRKEVLRRIRKRLRDQLPCRVVSTSLVEAGVDLDFPVVYRAKAGLDSIIQAAGRCNREGRAPAAQSPVYVFEADHSYHLPGAQQQAAAVLDMLPRQYHSDLGSPQAIQAYFETLYRVIGQGLDGDKVVQSFEKGARDGLFPFQSVGESFRLIQQNTRTVIIPIDSEAASYVQQLQQGYRSQKLLRQLGRYSVNVYESHYEKLYNAGIIQKVDKELAVLRELGSYHPETGLTLNPQGGRAIFVEV